MMVCHSRFSKAVFTVGFVLAGLLLCTTPVFGQTIRFRESIAQTLPKIVKIFGSGGSRGLEAYQSGILISADGYLLTAWSYVLDSGLITATMNDGYRAEAKLVGFDPRLDIAILKIPVTDAPFFSLEKIASAETGDRVLAFSNLYNVASGDEPVSIQQGFVSSVSNLAARQGTYQSPYQGEALLIDAMTNNPGSAGGAVTDRSGQLIAVIGKEVRDQRTGAWLNYAVPIEKLKSSIAQILDGEKPIAIDQADADRRQPAEPMTPGLLGLSLVPNVVKRTPPYIDRVATGSAADRAGLQADDLIIELDGVMTATAQEFMTRLQMIDRDRSTAITVQRGNQFLERELRVSE